MVPFSHSYICNTSVDIESVDVSIDADDSDIGIPSCFMVSGLKETSHKDESRSICCSANSMATTCSSKGLQEALLNALKIKKTMRTRSGASLGKRWPGNTSVSTSKPKVGKENSTVRGSQQQDDKEQQILDIQWRKLVNQSNSRAVSPMRDKSPGKVPYSPRVVPMMFNARYKSPDCPKVAAPTVTTTKRQIGKGIIEIVTTKARKDARSLSPIAQRIQLPGTTQSPAAMVAQKIDIAAKQKQKLVPKIAAIKLISAAPQPLLKDEAQKKQRRRRDERIKQKEQVQVTQVVFDVKTNYATAPHVEPFRLVPHKHNAKRII